MSALAILLNRLLDLARFFAWLPPLLTRVFVGALFVEAGWGKLQHLDKVQGFFVNLGIPAPSVLAPLVASLELGCGLLILVGLATRLACLPLMVIMAVAVLTAKKDELTGFTALAGIGDFLYILLFLWLAVYGAGLVSLDALLGRKIRKLGA
jgi:putative oxidoreductase